VIDYSLERGFWSSDRINDFIVVGSIQAKPSHVIIRLEYLGKSFPLKDITFINDLLYEAEFLENMR
jgi:hypothetical protein